MMPRIRWWPLAAVTLVVGLAACSSDDAPDAGSSSLDPAVEATASSMGAGATTVLTGSASTSSSPTVVSSTTATGAASSTPSTPVVPAQPAASTSSSAAAPSAPTVAAGVPTSTAPAPGPGEPPPSPATAAARPLADPATTTPAQASPPLAPAGARDTDCTAGRSPAAGEFDLVHISVGRSGSSYRLTATYSGDANLHDVLLRFDLGGSVYDVDAELFEDGQGNAQLIEVGRADATFLDPPQVVKANEVDLTLRADQVPRLDPASLVAAVATLKVDGAIVETCP